MTSRLVAGLVAVIGATVLPAARAAEEPPREWVDADTGHRIVRLSDEPGSQSLYFHQNAYTPDGKKLIITTPSGLSTIDLATRKIEQVVEGKVNVIVTGRTTGRVYYSKDGAVYATDPGTKETTKVATLPEQGTVSTVNADETLLAGTITEYPEGQAPATQPVGPDGRPLTKAQRIHYRFGQHLPMELFFIEVKTGQVRTFNHCTDWLNHLQFSPTDPGLLMFCHEGPWEKVDRIWTIRADGSGVTKVHQRTVAMEIAGHEFFSGDGKTIWYDLQTPRGEDFWVAGYDLESGHRTRYHLQRNEWSVHFNVSPDGKLFAGDGGGPGMVAHAPDGQWIYLFRPEMPKDSGTLAPPDGKLIRTGVFRAERLVNMKRHDYLLEPNVTFTPDMKWIVFRSNMFGASHVFAVEIEKAH